MDLIARFKLSFTGSGYICTNCFERLSNQYLEPSGNSSSDTAAAAATSPAISAATSPMSAVPSPLQSHMSPNVLQEVVDTEANLSVLNETLVALNKSPISKRQMRSNAVKKRKAEEVTEMLQQSLHLSETDDGKMMIQQFKDRLAEPISLDEKYMILTCLPRNWTARQIQREMGISFRMARRSKAIQDARGILSAPLKKMPSNRLSEETATLIRVFYSDDEVSRACAGKREYVRVDEDGNTTKKQRRLIMCNLREAYTFFKARYPEIKIGFTKFAELRPKECVLALDKHGTHSVCVCEHHQNVKLILEPMKRLNILDELTNDYKGVLPKMICDNPTEKCHFNECEACPGTDQLINTWEDRFRNQYIERVNVRQWIKSKRSK